MEKNKQIEIILVSLFLVSLGIIILLFVSLDNSSTKITYSSTSTTIQAINYPSKITKCEVTKVPYKVYEVSSSYVDSIALSNKISYSDSSRNYIKEGIFGEEIQVYEVNLENTGCKGGYFKIIFSFTTLCGDEKEETIREYVPYGKEKSFVYKNLRGDRDKIASWNYKVISETESCSNPSQSSKVLTNKVVKEIKYKDEVVCVRI